MKRGSASSSNQTHLVLQAIKRVKKAEKKAEKKRVTLSPPRSFARCVAICLRSKLKDHE
jgi:hypothetical protein